MFKREETVRTAATNAIIDLIFVENKSKKNDLNSLKDSSSQASCSQQNDMPCRMGGSLFQALSGLLRRCLSEQVGRNLLHHNLYLFGTSSDTF